MKRSNVLASDSSYLDKQSGCHWDMMFFPIAHNSPHSFHCRLAPSLLWRLEVPALQSYQQVLGLPACLLPLKVKRLAHIKGLLMETSCSHDGEVQGSGLVILDLHSPIAFGVWCFAVASVQRGIFVCRFSPPKEKHSRKYVCVRRLVSCYFCLCMCTIKIATWDSQ